MIFSKFAREFVIASKSAGFAWQSILCRLLDFAIFKKGVNLKSVFKMANFTAFQTMDLR